ncbi:MAG: AAA family ATPase [Gammaproteobacteria bacterium]|nr:AAA family ATPase [Gammaproteobacteria bacterium]MCP4090124.1 AAA family ATPase [Gammaproteobacteria bacterium]MCP4276986.1 AAA family ATPase [Gammaproteobacteria bacterium]MCP4831758.1 AAA family ATPase [Gammaproteobacteria bacterium]MCP4929487.1 AAA family ATPase [Gammaproteobacteria bacterium]
MERIKEAVEQARRERNSPAAEQSSPLKEPAAANGVEVAAVDIKYTQIPTVEVSPAVREKNRLVAAIPGHPLLDSFRMLRTRVLQEMKSNNWNTLAVISPTMGAGKTLTAINLAIAIGRDLSHTALVVDADLRRPTVSSYFDYTPEYGINDFILNDTPLNKIFFHPDVDRLIVLPGREPMSGSAEVLSSPKFQSLFKDLRTRYSDRIIVVDSAPVLEVDDVLALIPNLDCMLIVVESGVTTPEDLSRTMELLQDIPVLGTVLNKVDKKFTVKD